MKIKVKWIIPLLLIAVLGLNEPLKASNLVSIVLNRQPASVKAIEIDGRAYVPIRYIAETFGADVSYYNNKIYINKLDADFMREPVIQTNIVLDGNSFTIKDAKYNYDTNEVTFYYEEDVPSAVGKPLSPAGFRFIYDDGGTEFSPTWTYSDNDHGKVTAKIDGIKKKPKYIRLYKSQSIGKWLVR